MKEKLEINKEKDFLKTCFNIVASLEVTNEDQAIAKEVVLSEVENLQQESKQLNDNWNKLKEIAKSQSGFKKRADLKGGLWFEIDELLDKMQELEQGSGSND